MARPSKDDGPGLLRGVPLRNLRRNFEGGITYFLWENLGKVET